MTKSSSKTWQNSILSKFVCKKKISPIPNILFWIDKHIPTSVSFSSTLIEEPIFLCISNPRDLVELFVNARCRLALGRLALGRLETRVKFLGVDTSVKSKLNQNLSAPNPGHCLIEPILEF